MIIIEVDTIRIEMNARYGIGEEKNCSVEACVEDVDGS